MIMQENRSFDSMFGTYPGVDGIPRDANGNPTVCSPDPWSMQCVRPYHDGNDVNRGGPHQHQNAVNDIDGGRMDGFIGEAEKSIAGQFQIPGSPSLPVPQCPVAGARTCAAQTTDVMGYHDRRELPVYWDLADRYVLQDHMFEPVPSWSLPAHLAMVSGWSASCTDPARPMSCTTNLDFGDGDGTAALPGNGGLGVALGDQLPSDGDDSDPPITPPDFGWTDLTYLMHQKHVSWGYYVKPGLQPDCPDGGMTCPPAQQDQITPEIWNPLPDFQTVHADHELGNIQDVARFYTAATHGTLPAVSWVVPSQNVSDHPPAALSDGQQYVTGLLDAVMHGPDWSSTAVFISWDDWGGFYDHVTPPVAGGAAYGLRVPGLVISPYARRHVIDHQQLSFDAYLRFIEDDFLGGQRLDPRTDGRPDARPRVAETAAGMGDLVNDFDFTQPPAVHAAALTGQGSGARQVSTGLPNTATAGGAAGLAALIAVTVTGRGARWRRRTAGRPG
jgi:phospholipase C